MKNSIGCSASGSRVALVCLSAVMSWGAEAAPKAATSRYPTPTGRIVYQMKNSGPMMMSSTITMTWANYGDKFRQDTQVRMGSGARARSMNSWSVYDGQSLYAALPGGGRRVIRMKVSKAMLAQMRSGMVSNFPGLNVSGGQVVGMGVVLGKPCSIRAATTKSAFGGSRIKLWMWQGIMLRSETSMRFQARPGQKHPPMAPINISMLATKLDLAAKTSPSMFRLPSGYTVQEMGDFAKGMRRGAR